MTANALRVLQITDMHIKSAPGPEFLASRIDTEETLQSVLDEIHANEPADSIVDKMHQYERLAINGEVH